jgi:regulator of sirC expression with transglutaminase-like and TPR domain
VRCFDRFCRILAAAGVSREPWEGPLDFSERAAIRFPAEAEKIRLVGNLYIRQRYGRSAAPMSDLSRAVRMVARLLGRRRK